MSSRIAVVSSVLLVVGFLIREASQDRSVVWMETTEGPAPRRADDRQDPAERNAMMGADLAATHIAQSRENDYRAFLKRTTDAYPLQSLKDRLLKLPSKPSTGLSKEAEDDLREFEATAEGRFNRSWALKDVHDQAVQKFSETQGQGVRRVAIFSKEMIDSMKRSDEAPLQPEIVGTTVAEPAATAERIEDALKSLHRTGIGDFASPEDFGYVADDGKKAAGFIPHRFTKTPPIDPRLRLRRIDLVGLLLHPQPVVYISDKLPRMEELTAAPMRAPDDFEAKAIEAIQKGETLVLREDESEFRMVGAIRAAKQCIGCHACERGELLGAFSYRFEQL